MSKRLDDIEALYEISEYRDSIDDVDIAYLLAVARAAERLVSSAAKRGEVVPEVVAALRAALEAK